MNRYEAFKDALALVEERCDVTFATTENYMGNIEVAGTDGEYDITITVVIKEVKKDGN